MCLHRQCIAGCRAERGIIKNAPSGYSPYRLVFDESRDTFESSGRVRRIVGPGRSVKPEIKWRVVPTRFGGGWNARGVGCHPCDSVLAQQQFNFVREPGFVPRLEHDIAFVTLAELREKGIGRARIERKAGRKLDENRPALRTESGSLAQK